MFRIIDGQQKKVIPNMVVGIGGVTEGALVAYSSGTVIMASAGTSTAVILGIAKTTEDAGDTVDVELVKGRELEVDYTGSSKSSLAAGDIGDIFDLDDTSLKIDLDDTTGAMFVITGYNNDVDRAKVRIIDALCYIG